MSTLDVTPDRLHLRLTWPERLAAVHGDLVLPRTSVTGVELVPDGVSAARGLRAPGLAVPGGRKLGTWRGRSGRQFVDVRRGQPALRIELAAGQPYRRLLLGSDEAPRLARELGAADSRDIATESGGVRLVGTLVLPETPGPHPVALLVNGSGPLDRDGGTRRLRLDVSRTLAEALAAHGVASLRYDKRGVGGSGGSFLAAGLSDNVEDAGAWLRELAALPEVDAARMVVVGHSEGALIAATLGAATPTLSGVVLLAGTARTGEEVLLWQAEQVAPSLPRPVRLLLRVTRTDLTTKVRRTHARLRATTTDVVRMGLVRVNARWFREFLEHDPRPDLARLTSPVLALTGGKDLQTPPEDLEVVHSLVPGPCTVVRLDDVTHLLRSEPGPASVRTYRAQVRRPVDEQVVRTVTEWVASVVA